VQRLDLVVEGDTGVSGHGELRPVADAYESEYGSDFGCGKGEREFSQTRWRS
jgi:hypothetical protein